MTTKLCIDCQWMGSTRTPDDPFCNHPDVPKSLVNGKTVTRCNDNRHNAAICGIEGKLFSSKAEAKAKEEAEAKKRAEAQESRMSQWKSAQKPVGETQKVYGYDFPSVSDRAAQVIKKKVKSK